MLKAIVYYVVTMDELEDDERERQLDRFIKKHKLSIESIYYDIINDKNVRERKGIDSLLHDLRNKTIKADAFVAMSVQDLGKDKFIDIIAEINSYVPHIFFTEIEQ